MSAEAAPAPSRRALPLLLALLGLIAVGAGLAWLRHDVWLGLALALTACAGVLCGARLARQGPSTRDLEPRDREHLETLSHVAVLEAAVRSAPNAILITDRDGRISWVNRATVELTGYPEGELLGTFIDLAPHLDRDGGRVWEGQIVSRRKDGRFIVEEQTIAPVPGPRGEIEHFVAIRRDVTRQKQGEDALNLAHAELRLIVDSITAILIGLDAEGRVSAWNAHAERYFGLPASRALGARLQELELELPFASSVVTAALERCLTEGRDQRLDEVPFLRAEGGQGYLGITLSPMRAVGGWLRGCLLLARDITHRKNLEAQLARAQKLESLGQLAAGIAHEINTPTQFVSDNTTFLKSSLQDLAPLLEAGERLRHAERRSPEFQAALEAVLAAAERADAAYVLAELPRAIDDSLAGLERISGIVRAMKEFSHPGSDKKESVDVNRGIQSTVTVARNEWKYVAELELDLAPDLPLVPCHPQDVNQVVLNMIVNAAHAIQDKRKQRGGEELGRIRIRTRAAGEHVEIRISDTGCGIPEAIRARIFDPFFTTKEVGKGTGQGLAIAHHVVVEKHGGTIEVESEVGVGTTFAVRLPLAEEAAPAERRGVSSRVH